MTVQSTFQIELTIEGDVEGALVGTDRSVGLAAGYDDITCSNIAINSERPNDALPLPSFWVWRPSGAHSWTMWPQDSTPPVELRDNPAYEFRPCWIGTKNVHPLEEWLGEWLVKSYSHQLITNLDEAR